MAMVMAMVMVLVLFYYYYNMQETHLDSSTDTILFNLSDYTLISDPARINSFGGLATYVHNSFSFKRISIEELNQNSTVYENIVI